MFLRHWRRRREEGSEKIIYFRQENACASGKLAIYVAPPEKLDQTVKIYITETIKQWKTITFKGFNEFSLSNAKIKGQ
ncbi:hypothetical protein BH713_03160 [Enterobacter kobei]|uniref:Uncharacterized protein n=1 Tax=Enterobacter kobei TaxID=208224 RepID=A0ACC8S891_9ENTR|nr:hypothetical protein BH713_03160 [Enterobacter kobei]